MKIGVISDTHGYFNPKILPVFQDVEQILHAGDVGCQDVITCLETIAPVTAVHGNVDTYPINSRYPDIQTLELIGWTICLLHFFINLKNPIIQKAIAKTTSKKIDVIIYGHTHQAKLHRLGDILIFNPGAAGKQRISNFPSVGLLSISENGKVLPEIINLHD